MIRTEDGTRRGIQGGERRLLEGDQMQANRLRGEKKVKGRCCERANRRGHL